MFYSDDHFYIIRSDIDTPLMSKSSKLNNVREKPNIHTLPQAFRKGDHYFGVSNFKYVIHGNMIHVARNIGTDAGAINWELPKECQGGEHYMLKGKPNFLIAKANFYMVKDNILTRFKHSSNGIVGTIGPSGIMESIVFDKAWEIHNKLKDGLCYFADEEYFYVVKMIDKGNGDSALGYYQVKHLHRDPDNAYHFISDSLTYFIPGGQLIDNPISLYWKKIKSLTYEDVKEKGMKSNNGPGFTYTEQVEYSYGVRKEITNIVENHWSVTLEVSRSIGVNLGIAIMEANFKLGASYGQSNSRIEKEEWVEGILKRQSFEVELEAGQSWACFQAQAKIGEDTDVLWGSNLVITSGQPPRGKPWES